MFWYGDISFFGNVHVKPLQPIDVKNSYMPT
jgi:hypothetical protein